MTITRRAQGTMVIKKRKHRVTLLYCGKALCDKKREPGKEQTVTI